MSEPHYRRVIVKLSGEALTGKQGFGVEQIMWSFADKVIRFHAKCLGADRIDNNITALDIFN